MADEPSLKALRRNFDELAITAALAKVAFSNADLDARDQVILAAFRRSHPRFAEAEPEEIGSYLRELDDHQLAGTVNIVKGTAHEILYVEMENDDGDTITADLFPETNHPGTDVILYNEQTGETFELQLKATENEAVVRDWLAAHPDGRIAVTEELAEKMGLPSSGFSSREITTDTEEFLDRATDDESLWDYFPTLSIASVSLVVLGLYRRYRAGAIGKDRFYRMVAAATGWKIAKISLLSTLLAIPAVNVGVGALLVAKMLMSARTVLVRP